ncbi:glucose PTS transporter subunit IIA [Lachnospiraceae bacterium 54-53]
MSEVKDDTFSKEVLGKGMAIVPADGRIYAPCSGTVVTAYPHAVGLITESGAEAFVHFGLDTVKLEGGHFDLKVKEGDKVKTGDLLIEADIDSIKKEGYDVTIMVLVTNTGDYADVLLTSEGDTKAGDAVLTCIPK